jgi:hypothetical protein
MNLNVSGFILSHAATESDIENAEKNLKTILPNSYKQLLKTSNGLATNEGMIIYGIEDILERNATWEIQDYAPGFISIGDDSGGRVFLMSLDNKEQILIVDSGDMNLEHAELITTNLFQWINNGLRIDMIETSNDNWSEICKIVVVGTPDGALRDLIKIKGKLGLNIPTSELIEGSKNLPFLLTDQIPYGKAKKIIEGMGDLNVKIEFQSS